MRLNDMSSLSLQTPGFVSARAAGLRKLALTLIAGVLAAPFGTAALAAETVKVRLDFLPYGLHAPFYLAQEKGWFAEQGLEVEIEDGNGTGPALALVAGGKYDIAQVSLGALPIAREKGMPVKSIATILRKGDFGLVVDDAGPIKTPKDLEGKTILYSPGSVETPFIDTYLAAAGVDKSKVNLTSVDVGAKISSYMSGKGEGMFAPVSLYSIKGVTPRASRPMLFTDYNIDLPGFGLVANEETIAKRPKVLAGFVIAFQRAWIAIRSGGMIDESVAALLKHRPMAKLNPVVMKAQIESVFPFIESKNSAGRPMLSAAPADWAATVKVMEAAKLIKAGTSAEGIYTNQFVPAGK
jgi:NitT/TauT family transport system substrate-binding protein